MSRMMRLLIVTMMIAAPLSIAQASPATAACGSGDICYWGEDSYSGCAWDTPYDQTTLSDDYWHNCSTYSVNQGANSAKNYGNSCTIIFYDYTLGSGGHHWMSRVGLGGYWLDANFGNNNWSGSGSGTVENDISSHDFCG